MRGLHVLLLLIAVWMGSVATPAAAQRYQWMWTASSNFGGPGSSGPSADPAALCRQIDGGLTVLYYQGIWFTHIEYLSETHGHCWDYNGTIVNGKVRGDDDPTRTFGINLKCIQFNSDGSTATTSAINCEAPCPCEREFGNPIAIPNLVNIERAEDFLSGLDPRFAFLRSYRSDASFYNATAAISSINGRSGLGALSFDGPWRLNYDEIVQHNSGVYRYRLWDGHTARFAGMGSTTPPATGWPYTISAVTAPFGTRWLVEDGTGLKRYFAGTNSTRYLTEMVWPDGYTITITREADHQRTTAIADNRGQRAQFTWSVPSVPYVDPGVVTRIDIDFAYNGTTFAPDVALTYAYTSGSPSWAKSTIAEASILDLATSTTEVQAAYDYLPMDDAYPPALTTSYDGRRDALGQLLPTTTTAYREYSSLALSTSYADGTGFYGLDPTYGALGAEVDSVTVTNPLGLETDYDIDVLYGAHRIVQEDVQATADVDAAMRLWDFTPNTGGATGFLYERVEWNGAITEFVRDARGLVTQKTEDATGLDPRVTTYTWHGTLRLPLTRTTTLMKETFAYDTNGLLTSYTQEDVLTGSPSFGQTRTWAYGYTTLASGLKVLTTIDGPGTSPVVDVTTLAYATTGTAAGRLLTITDPNGLVTEILAYDALGRPAQVEDEQGFIWDLAYDVEGRLLEAVFEDGTAAEETLGFTYDATGQMLTSTDAQGRVTSYAYDVSRRLVGIEAPAGETIAFIHDDMGNVTETTYSDTAAITTYYAESTYDELGRLLQDLGAIGQVTTYDHDVEGNVVEETDSFSFATTYDHDPLNRLVEMVDRAGATTEFAYDEGDNRTLFEDGRNLATTFEYNGFGEAVEEVSPDRGTLTYAYDSRGLVASMTDGRGVATQYGYDNGGRLTSKTYPSQSALDQSFTYHASAAQPWNLGTMATASDQMGTSTFARDPATGEVATETRTMGGVSYPIAYDWAVRGELASTTYPSGAVLSYAYDANGNLEALSWVGIDPGTGLPLSAEDVATDIAYAPFGDVTIMLYGDGATHTASYDSSYRLEELKDVGSGMLREVDYLWSLNDDLASATDALVPALSESYDYAPRQELETATGPWGTLDWTYDATGNRATQALTVGATTTTDTYAYPSTSNRLASIALGAGGTRTLTHDAAGNVTADSRTGTAYGYTYDAAGRMATLSLNSTLQASYGYSFLGQQVVRTLASPSQVIHAVHDQTGNRIAEYLYDPATSTSTLIREYVWADGRLVGVFEAGQLYFVRTDHIGRPVFATDDTGTVVWTASYLPFGGVQASTGPNPALRFPGQWFQAEAGLHQNWMRDYDPNTGRYLQADPLGIVDGASVYGYARQSPLRWTDPQGEETIVLGPLGRSPGENWRRNEDYLHEGGVQYIHLCSHGILEFHYDAREIAGGHWHYYPNGTWMGGGRRGPLARLWDRIIKSDHLPPYTVIDVPDCVCGPGTDPITPQLPPS